MKTQQLMIPIEQGYQLNNSKYHPELQIPIEQGWCDAKKKFKDMQDFKIKKTEEVMERINHCLDTIPVERIRKWFRKNRLYEDAYYDPTTSAENILERVKALKKARNQHRTAPRV
eukprot:841064_1